MKKIILFSLPLCLLCNASAQIGINTEAPQSTLHVEGDMILKETPLLNSSTSNLRVLVRGQDGRIGTAASTPARLLFVESRVPYEMKIGSAEAYAMRTEAGCLIPWEEESVISNNLMEFDSENHWFTFTEDALCEVKGYINYKPNASILVSYPTNIRYGLTVLYLIVQHYDSASSQWTDFTTTSTIWTGGSVYDTVKTVTLPPAVKHFKIGDRIRMIIKCPTDVLSHFTEGQGGIVSPTGLSTTKCLKIVAL